MFLIQATASATTTSVLDVTPIGKPGPMEDQGFGFGSPSFPTVEIMCDQIQEFCICKTRAKLAWRSKEGEI